MAEKVTISKLPHHVQEKLCETRPPYRQGRRLTAVKVAWWTCILFSSSYCALLNNNQTYRNINVYTVNDESQHLLICGVPKLQLSKQVEQLLSHYGNIKNICVVSNYPSEEFTETFHVQYARIQSARIAKRFVDRKNFYGGLLHVCYAPELESLAETREKLFQRRKEVLARIKRNKADPRNPDVDQFIPEEQYHRRKKTPALPLTQQRLERFYPNETLTHTQGNDSSVSMSGPQLSSHLIKSANNIQEKPVETYLEPPYQLYESILRSECGTPSTSNNDAQCKRKNYKGRSVNANFKVKITRPDIIDTRSILRWDDTTKNIFTNVKKVESGITIKVAPKCDNSKRIRLHNPSATQLVQPSEALQLSIQSAKDKIRSAMQGKDTVSKNE